ncbi:MAG: hypothetical protein COB08_015930 [Rhodobacteraceae bacterium]|nr:hypothetical protein [Paracoccaceae bacterium]
MLEHFSKWQRITLYAALSLWLIASVASVVLGYSHLFGALGSFALCISFVVFLTDRFMAQEARRRWDSQILTQSRMMWRYFSRIEDAAIKDPTPMPKLRDQITNNFDDLLAAKAEEKAIETYKYELAFSVLGTLQWGFGKMLIELIRGT